MGSGDERRYEPYFEPGRWTTGWRPVESDNDKLVAAIGELKKVLEEIRDIMVGSTGPIITGIHALTEFRRIVSQ